MTGHTLLAFRWMAARAKQALRRGKDDEARVYSECAYRLKMFAEMPLADVTAKLARSSGPNRLGDIIGKWPGDESDEQIAKALEEVS